MMWLVRSVVVLALAIAGACFYLRLTPGGKKFKNRPDNLGRLKSLNFYAGLFFAWITRLPS